MVGRFFLYIAPFVSVLLVAMHLEVIGASTGPAGKISSSTSTASAACNVTRGPYLQLSRQSSIVVRWRTDVPCDSRVRFGRSTSNLDIVVDNPTQAKEHVIRVTGLQAWQQYYYTVGTRTTVLSAGNTNRIITSPIDHHPGVIQRIWALGNAGTGGRNASNVQRAYLNFTGSKQTNLVLLLGDNAFPSGKDADYQKAVFNMFRGVLRQTSVLPTLGHIDTAGSVNPPLTIPYFRVFTLPTGGGGGGFPSRTEKYYSYNFGIIHFVCLDSQTSDLSPNGPMLTWLKQDLAANTMPWLVAFFHHAPYSKGSRDSDVDRRMTAMRTRVLPILESYGVDLVLAAHSFSYERSYFLNGHYGFSSTLSPKMVVNNRDGRPGSTGGEGVYHKKAGAKNAGAVYVLAGSAGRIGTGTFNHPAMYMSLNKLGSFVFDVFNNRLDAKFVQADGNIGDYFSIVKDNQAPTMVISSPSDGATFAAPANISLAAQASDVDSTIQRLKFFANGVKLFDDYHAPYTYTWRNVPAGTYQISAEVRDDMGATTRAKSITITVK